MAIDIYEYKVVPAPRRGQKAKGVKGSDGRFAKKLEVVMNELASDGWEYIRTDTLPAEERKGLTKTVTVFQNVMVFRRKKYNPVIGEPVAAVPAAAPTIQPETPIAESATSEAPDIALDTTQETPPEPDADAIREAAARSIFKSKGVNEEA